MCGIRKNGFLIPPLLKMKIIRYILILLVTILFTMCSPKEPQVTMDMLLEEMVSFEESSRIPKIPYKTFLVSSYDRISMSPDMQGWFANDDGRGVIRIDTVGKRYEKVLFEAEGAGTITRFFISAAQLDGVLRFYFDDRRIPTLILNSYDLTKLGENGLIYPHTSYIQGERGGSTLYLPIPFAKSCKITFEDLAALDIPHYYQIDYRLYDAGTTVETFSLERFETVEHKIQSVNNRLLNPYLKEDLVTTESSQKLPPSHSMSMELPSGENAIYEIIFRIKELSAEDYPDVMRHLIFKTSFDGVETSWVPLSDFSGGGIGAFVIDNWYLTSDGNGTISSRWFMPYQNSAILSIENLSDRSVEIDITAKSSSSIWDERSLYFHASWHQEVGLPLSSSDMVEYDNTGCYEWNFATLQGRGIYKGDILTLYNHAPRWFGEGDNKIWVDDDSFPTHFGTGTGDYYNSSLLPPIETSSTPFGGVIRSDNRNAHGFNTFVRTRNLDGIPFEKGLKFDFELLGWLSGKVDYASTVYWYGDIDSKAIILSTEEEILRKIVIE